MMIESCLTLPPVLLKTNGGAVRPGNLALRVARTLPRRRRNVIGWRDGERTVDDPRLQRATLKWRVQ